MSQVREITEEYRLKRVLKTAPQTTVFLAADPRTGAEVALKLISPAGMSPSDAQRERFEGFMEVIRSLETPGLPRILEHGFMPDGSAFIVAGLVTGQDLQSLGPLEPQRATPLLAQALTTLETLGSHRVHHHNLRSDNLFVTGGGAGEQVVLLGLGTAAYLAEKEGDQLLGQSRETDPDAAPERFDPGLRSAEPWRADLYSMALVICRSLQLQVQGPGTTDPVVHSGPKQSTSDTEQLFAALSIALRREPSQRQVSYAQMRNALLGAALSLPGTQDIRASLQGPGTPVPEKTLKVKVPADVAAPTAPAATTPPPTMQLPAMEGAAAASDEITAEESLEDLGITGYETVAEMDLSEYANAMQEPEQAGTAGPPPLPEPAAPPYAPSAAAEAPPPPPEDVVEPPPPPPLEEAAAEGLDFDTGSTSALPSPEISELVESLQRRPTTGTEPVLPPAAAAAPPEQPAQAPDAGPAPPPVPPAVPAAGDVAEPIAPPPPPAGGATEPVPPKALPEPELAPPPLTPESPGESVAPPSGPRWPVEPPVTMAIKGQGAAAPEAPAPEAPTPEPTPPPPPVAKAEAPRARLAGEKKSLLVPILAASGGFVLIVAAAVVAWMLLRGPADEVVAEPTPVPVPTAVPSPEPRVQELPAVHPQLERAEQLMDEGDADAAREALAAITPEEREGLSDSERTLFDELTQASEAEDLSQAIADLRGGLDYGSIPMLKRSLEVLSNVDEARIAEEAGLKEQLEHAREVLQLHSLLWRSHNAGEHLVVLERAAAMIEMLPKYSGSFNLREEHATALQQQAEAAVQAGDFDSAVDQLEAIREYWPDRPGLAERIEWCRNRQGMEQRMEGVLRTARNKAKAGDPEGALQVLSGVQPTGSFSASFATLRKELEAQLATKDAEAPTISISGNADLQFKKNQPFRIPFTITDDYKVTATAIMVKTSNRPVFAEMELVHSGGSNYFFEVTATMHNNDSVFFYVTARDRSGHTARLGSPEQPLELKRKRWFR